MLVNLGTSPFSDLVLLSWLEGVPGDQSLRTDLGTRGYGGLELRVWSRNLEGTWLLGICQGLLSQLFMQQGKTLFN